MRWLVRFGYDGTAFCGWARQPGLRTVEGTIRGGVVRGGLSAGPDLVTLEVASRTDRGVSARANALALDCDLSGPNLLRALNGISPELLFSAASPVAPEFKVRGATRRVYRYFERVPDGGISRWERAARLFAGEIDVRSFGRRIPAKDPCWRRVESVSIRPADRGIAIEVRAPSFVWGMVRKIVAALREHGSGRLTLERLEAATLGRERLTLPMAEPEGLVLWEVEYPFGWAFRWTGPNRHQARRARAAREALWIRSQLLRALNDQRLSTVRRDRIPSVRIA
jgi:tRNA pseudouridine38-40 synthase